MTKKTKQQKKSNTRADPKVRGMGKKPKFKGNGVYGLTAMTKALKGIVATQVAKKIPQGSFERAGAALGRGLARFTGFGDYIMNDIVHTTRNAPAKSRSHVISNCEFITDIKTTASSNNFDLREFIVNASQEQTFPWLAAVARQYTKYRFTQLLFEYRTMSSDYSANVGLGSVIMAPLYNINQSNWSTKQQMEAATHAVSFKPSNSAVCGVECAASDNNFKWFNVRTAAMEVTPFTDPIRFTLALSGTPATIPASTTLGELWVHYTVELIEPILYRAPDSGYTLGGVRSTDTTAGLVDTRMFGLGSTGSQFQGPLTLNGFAGYGPGGAGTGKALLAYAGKPPDTQDYFVSWCINTYAKFYFRDAGFYSITWSCTFSTPPTSNTPGLFALVEDNITNTTELLGVKQSMGGVQQNIGMCNQYANITDKKCYSQTWFVKVKANGGFVDVAKVNGVTGYNVCAIEGSLNGSQIVISYTPF